MPVGGCEVLEASDVNELIRSWDPHGEAAYAVLCDLHCPGLEIELGMLSEEQQALGELLGTKTSRRLVPYLGDQKNVLRHVGLLQVWQRLGVQITSTKIFAFRPTYVFWDWIMGCHTQRMEADSEVEKMVLKTSMRATFGKTIENKGRRSQLAVVTDVEKWVQGPGFIGRIQDRTKDLQTFSLTLSHLSYPAL